MQGDMIGKYLVENFDAVDLNGDGSISYAMFMGQLGNVEAIYRTQYAVEDANKVLTEAGKAEKTTLALPFLTKLLYLYVGRGVDVPLTPPGCGTRWPHRRLGSRSEYPSPGQRGFPP